MEGRACCASRMIACCVTGLPPHLPNMGVYTMACRDAGHSASGRHHLSVQLPATLHPGHCWSSRSNPDIRGPLHEEEHVTQQSLHETLRNLNAPVRAAGLPIGLQLMGQAWAEARLLTAGAVLEAAVRSRVHPPHILYDLLPQ